MGFGVLFETAELMDMTASGPGSLETLKTIRTLELVTTTSGCWSGKAEENVHSSSAAEPFFWALREDGSFGALGD